VTAGVQVAVQKERERSKNRFLAMRALVERLEEAQVRKHLPSGGNT
jgi:protein subunit release factor A